ncbi:unnamed protein product, partial [marine sediment metagenome]
MDFSGFENMSPNQRRAAFMKANGDDCIIDENQCWFIFENGSCMERNILGAFKQAFTAANTDDSRLIKETLRLRLYYAQRKLGAAIRIFESTKEDLESRANDAFAAATYPPTDDEVQKLYDAKTEVEKFQTKVEAVELELNPPSPPAQQQLIDPAVRAKAQATLETIR